MGAGVPAATTRSGVPSNSWKWRTGWEQRMAVPLMLKPFSTIANSYSGIAGTEHGFPKLDNYLVYPGAHRDIGDFRRILPGQSRLFHVYTGAGSFMFMTRSTRCFHVYDRTGVFPYIPWSTGLLHVYHRVEGDST